MQRFDLKLQGVLNSRNIIDLQSTKMPHEISQNQKTYQTTKNYVTGCRKSASKRGFVRKFKVIDYTDISRKRPANRLLNL